MATSGKRILIFVEDPGAANFAMPLFDALESAGWSTQTGAHGPAIGYLTTHGRPVAVACHDAGEWIARLCPDVVMVGTSENPSSFAFSLVQAAREAKTPSIGMVDGPSNPELRFRGLSDDPLAYLPDWLLLTDETSRAAFTALGVPPGRMVVTGHPYYDAVREEGRRLRAVPHHVLRHRHLPHASQDRPVVAFLGEGSDGLGLGLKRRSADYSLYGTSGSNRRTEIVLEEFLDAVGHLDPRPYLVFRAHPKDPADNYRCYLDRFDVVSSDGPALPMLCACDLVVGLSTSLLVEAALIGLSTLSILPADSQRTLVATIATGATPCVTDRAALNEILPRLLRANIAPLPHDANVDPAATATAHVIDALSRIAQGVTP